MVDRLWIILRNTNQGFFNSQETDTIVGLVVFASPQPP